jgi:hypothetical protein
MTDRDPNYRIAEQQRAKDALVPFVTRRVAPSWGDDRQFTATWRGYCDWLTLEDHLDPILSHGDPMEDALSFGTAKLTPTDCHEEAE